MNAEKLEIVADRIEALGPGEFDMDKWGGCIAYWALEELRPEALEPAAGTGWDSVTVPRDAQRELDLDDRQSFALFHGMGWPGRTSEITAGESVRTLRRMARTGNGPEWVLASEGRVLEGRVREEAGAAGAR